MHRVTTVEIIDKIVSSVTKKITEKRLKWYGHVKRRDEGHVLMKNVRCISNRKETERKTENQVERLVQEKVCG